MSNAVPAALCSAFPIQSSTWNNYRLFLIFQFSSALFARDYLFAGLLSMEYVVIKVNDFQIGHLISPKCIGT